MNMGLNCNTRLSEDVVSNRLIPGLISTFSIKEEKQVEFEMCGNMFLQLMERCKDSDMSVYILLLTCLKVLWYKYTGNDQIVISSPMLYKFPHDIVDNLLPIVSEISSEMDFKTYLSNVREYVLKAYDNHQLQDETDELCDALALSKSICLFKELHGQLDIGVAPDVLIFSFERQKNKILGRIMFNSCVYHESMVEQFARHLYKIVDSVLEETELKIREIKIVDENAKATLLNFGLTKLEYPEEHTISQLFKKKAKEVPELVAVLCNNIQLTYRELDEKSNQIARVLRDQGIRSNSIVGIMAERSIEMVLGILGILKAGGAYLPIDGNYPKERIKELLEDSNAEVLLTQSSYAHTISFLNKTVWYLDEQELYNNSIEDLESINSSSDLAYVIYTSGSTGKPKGVLINHKNVINLVLGLNKHIYAKHDKALNVALVAPFIFDASVQQIFATLLLGHTLFIVPESKRSNGEELTQFLIDNSIDITDGTPTHIKLMYNYLSSSEANTDGLKVKNYIIGGEALNSKLVKNFLSLFDRYDCLPEMVNVYGPTECCVDSTIYPVNFNKLDETLIVPIGIPMPNERMLILDKSLELVPFGATGELYISGDGVGNGYLNNQELTNEKFISNPLVPGEILYATGDLARWMPSGNIEFLGRVDNLIKIRGLRIEPGEIENQILNFHKKDEEDVEVGKVKALFPEAYCTKCGLPTNYPGANLDSNGICSICHEYEHYQDSVEKYFKNLDDLKNIIKKVRGSQDKVKCMLLYSGGKDSSYVLYKLVELGLDVTAFTFDNGYMSDAAFKNIKRVTYQLNVESIIYRIDNMKEIFVESLKSDCTVCTGCFKAVTTISTKIALDKGIKLIFTGLSRGQIFDTKLYGLFHQGIYDTNVIDKKLLDFRKMYHGYNDQISRLINMDIGDETLLDHMYFIDYFRYDDISTPEIKSYLKGKDQYWIKPVDTGFCSTNCLVNDAGIWVHLREKGYHNYASPLSWECRLNKGMREDTIKEISGKMDINKVTYILEELGYNEQESRKIIKETVVVDQTDEHGDKYLCAYIVSDYIISGQEIRNYLSQKIPSYMIPTYFVPVESIPLSINGKVNRRALPDPKKLLTDTKTGFEQKVQLHPVEDKMLELWRKTLDNEEISLNGNFFELGGHSMKATYLMSLIQKEFDINVPLMQIYRTPTLKGLANYVNEYNKEQRNQADDNLIMIKEGMQKHKHLFLIHDGSGEVEAYIKLCSNLNGTLNCWGIKANRLENFSPQNITIEKVATEYIEKIKAVQPQGPYYLAGWSIGGLIAFEIARQIELKKEKIEFLSMIDTVAPQSDLWGGIQAFDSENEKKIILKCLPYKELERGLLDISDFHMIWSYALDYVEQKGLVSGMHKALKPKFNSSIIDALHNCKYDHVREIIYYLNTIRSYYNARALYIPSSKVKTPLYYFKATESDVKNETRWNLYCENPVNFYTTGGNHFSMFKEPHINKLSQLFNKCIV